jgi:mannose-6-phosphate isomerase-like protein (cupin superfamily)
MQTTTGAVSINLSDLPFLGSSHELEGYQLGDVQVSLIFFDGGPGSGPKLHSHPYPEIFVVQEGEALFTVGDEQIEARGDQILVAPAGVPHKFVNIGEGRLRQLDIHLNDRFVTEWLEA